LLPKAAMSAPSLQWECTDSPRADNLDVVDAELHLCNLKAADLDAVRPLACLARDAAGKLIGGLRARQSSTGLEVRPLWADESTRRQGVDARLMQMLEQAVAGRGARLSYLDNFTFPVPAFYRRCGFAVAARIDGLPDGIARFVMTRTLAGEAALR